ncbi:MAG: alpha/beta hydrolase [Bacterioplanes sp.]|nr:alpha/beta hydrolase [Bacterioplanes sp.]
MSEFSTPQRRVFQCIHGDVVALTWGCSDDPCLLMLHGWLDNAASFASLAPLLSTHYVVALDLPGHGESMPLLPGASYYIWDYMDVLYQVIAQLSGPVTLLGHSMGGVSALLYAATFPDRISRLILLDSLGPFVNQADQAPSQLRKGVEQALRRHQKRDDSGIIYPTLAAAVHARQQVDARLQAHEIEAMVARNLRTVNGGLAWRTDPRLRDASKLRMTEPMVRAFLQQVVQPCLLLRAEHSIIPSDWFEQRSLCLRNARTQTIAGHHHFHLQAQSLPSLSVAVKDFLNAVE